MMAGTSTWRLLGALALLAALAGLLAIGSRHGEPTAAEPSQTFQTRSFEVRVVKPLSARPLFGLFGLLPARELGFDDASPGAAVGRVGHDRLELRADGWDLSIETDGEGRVAAGTRLVFSLELAGRQVELRCSPADRAFGRLRTAPQAGSDEVGGSFRVKLATCANTATGRVIEWPPAPLTVVGRFDRLPHRGAAP